MILRRYIVKQCLLMTLIMLFILTALDFFFGLIGNLNGSSLVAALWFMVWRLPEDANQLVPISALLGTLFALGQLSRNSELVVMRVSGFSVLKIIQAVAYAGALLAALLLVNTLWLKPWANQQLSLQNKAHAGASANRMQPTLSHLWLKNQQGLVNIEAFWPNGVLTGVSRYRFANGTLVQAEYAKTVRYQEKSNHWQAQDVKVVKVTANKQRIGYQTHGVQTWYNLMTPELLALVATPAYELNASGLVRNILYRYDNSLDSNQYQFVLWQGLFVPLSVILMMLLAVPFVFGSARHISLGLKMMLGIFVGFAFFIMNQFVGSLSSLVQLSPLLAAALPSILCLLLFAYGVRYFAT